MFQGSRVEVAVRYTGFDCRHLSMGSISMTRFMLDKSRMRPPSIALAAPLSPDPPPRGTTATPWSLQRRSTSSTSAAETLDHCSGRSGVSHDA